LGGDFLGLATLQGVRLLACCSTQTKPNAYDFPMKKIAVYSGTFDPITLGHQDVISRAAKLFDVVIVGVSVAHSKKTLFSLAARIELTQYAMKNIANIQVLPFDGLIVDFCVAQGAQTIVRGIRNATDLDYEAQMAAMNRKLRSTIDTVFLLPTPDLQCISSTLVREISKLGGDVSQMVSPAVAQALEAAHRPKLQA
jgi:pantetheine-phosphate adenylyltransferase